MVVKCSIPIDHKEDDQSKRKVHQKKYDAASAVLDKLGLHSFTGSVFSCVAHQKEAHYGKADIVRAE